MSISRFLESNTLKALLGKSPEFLDFAVEASEKPIIGIPPEIAHEYWMEQVANGNTNAAEAVGKTNTSIIDFLNSSTLKALLGKRPELSSFAVENSEKPIIGIPPEIAHEYWMEQVAKGNTKAAEAVGKAESSIRHFLESNGFKALLGKPFQFATFAVEASEKPIIGIPPEIAHEYWMEQVAKGNTKARSPPALPLGQSLT